MNEYCPDELVAEAASCHADTDAPRRPDRFLWFVVSSITAFYVLGLILPHSEGEVFNIATMAHGVVELFNKMWWGLALGVIFVGILAKIPRDLVMSVLGHRDGFSSLLRATLAGVLLDLCSHGILAVGMK